MELGDLIVLRYNEDGTKVYVVDLEELERERINDKLFEIVESMAQLDIDVRFLRLQRDRLSLEDISGIESTPLRVPIPIVEDVIEPILGPPLPIPKREPGPGGTPTIEEVRRGGIAPPQRRRSTIRRILDVFSPEDFGE